MLKMTVREMLAKGAFNQMQQRMLPDGKVDITLTRRGDRHRYHLVVRDLYKPNEMVLVDEVLEEVL